MHTVLLGIICINILNYIIPAISIILSTLLAYWLGLRAYRKQKSNEECRLTYLDNGIEALRKELAEGFSTFLWNWGMALTLLKYVRDFGERSFRIKPEDIPEKFVVYRPSTLGLNYFDKAMELLGSDITTKWSLSAFTNLNQASFFLTFDLGFCIRKFLENPKDFTSDGGTICKMYFEELEKHRLLTDRHYRLIDYLGELSKRIRSMQISYEDLSKIKEDEIVKKIVREMDAAFRAIEEKNKPKESSKVD